MVVAVVVHVETVRVATAVAKVDSVVRARRVVPQAASTQSSVVSSVVDSVVAVVVLPLHPRRIVDGVLPMALPSLLLRLVTGQLAVLLQLLEAGKGEAKKITMMIV